MFKTEYGEAAVEVLDILDNTEEDDVKKIPQEFIQFLVDNASTTYKVNFNHDNEIGKLKLKNKTKELLGYIYIKWWCDKKEQKEYFNTIRQNTAEKERIAKEKYNPDNIFKNDTKINEEENNIYDTDNTALTIEQKDNIFKKILNKIKEFFTK